MYNVGIALGKPTFQVGMLDSKGFAIEFMVCRPRMNIYVELLGEV